ncbi:MAG: DUF4249 domain-containing protein [Bacteroidota bacterium]|nr:DUF4249 domain-containing protein [Bacteroidota bacterium]
MKWIFGLVALSMLVVSCDNELVVTDKWKDIPVVWGLLNKSDTAHYIRVEKAFLDPTTSALDIARIPDSLYYDDAVVSIKRISNNQSFMLTRVNGDLEGYPRDGGIFAETPNYLYKIKANVINLVIGEEYEFNLDRGDGTPLVTAKTVILPKPVLRNPVANASLNLRPNTTVSFIWNEIEDAAIYDLKLRFHYREKTPETGNFFVPKSFEWSIVSNWEGTEFTINGTDFANIIKSNIELNPLAARDFDNIEIVLWAGGEELANFIRIIQANQTITSTQDIPTYTNLSEGIGIFSSRNVSYNPGFGLNVAALDSLRNGVITKDLNFN